MGADHEVTALVQGAGRLAMSQDVMSAVRPRRYFTVPKENVESVLEDLQQLTDFCLIEFQRILFAENVIHTAAV